MVAETPITYGDLMKALRWLGLGIIVSIAYTLCQTYSMVWATSMVKGG